MKPTANAAYWILIAVLCGFAFGVGRAIGGDLYTMIFT